jgi:hypothetical protein
MGEGNRPRGRGNRGMGEGNRPRGNLWNYKFNKGNERNREGTEEWGNERNREGEGTGEGE